jgi:hypothetical protein
MAEHDKHAVPHSTHDVPHGAYETTDADVNTLYKWGVAVFVVIFAAMGLMWALHAALETPPIKMDHEPTAMEMERILPPKPRLQVNQQLDLKQLRDNEEKQLQSYWWVQKQAGTVHIPIGRAMDIIAERGLPAAKTPPAAAAAK